MAPKPRDRYLKVELQIVDADPETGPGSYLARTLAEAKLTIPLRGDADGGVPWASLEVGTAIAAMAKQTARLNPQPKPAEPSASEAAPITDAPSRPLERGETYSRGPAVVDADNPF